MKNQPTKTTGRIAAQAGPETLLSALPGRFAAASGSAANPVRRLAGGPSRLPARGHFTLMENQAWVAGSTPSGREPEAITILLAEERPIMRQGIQNLLAGQKDIRVVGQAGDLGQLMELAEQHKPSVVMVAISIALAVGLKDLKRLLDEKCRAGVLVLVPHDSNSLWRHISESGVGDFITEQSGPDHLAGSIRKAYKNRAPVADGAGLPEHKPARIMTQKGPTRSASLPLTARELQVLRYVADGNTNKLMASRLSISVKTLEKHRQNLMDKLEIHDTATLTRYAIYAGVVRVSDSAA